MIGFPWCQSLSLRMPACESMKTGETRVRLRLFGPNSHADLEALVDTGATHTKISRSTAERLALAMKKIVTVELADGSESLCGLAEASVECEGSRMTVPILIGEEGEELLLGLTTLEALGLKVNPITHKLEPARFIEYARALEGPRAAQEIFL